MSDNERAV